MENVEERFVFDDDDVYQHQYRECEVPRKKPAVVITLFDQIRTNLFAINNVC